MHAKCFVHLLRCVYHSNGFATEVELRFNVRSSERVTVTLRSRNCVQVCLRPRCPTQFLLHPSFPFFFVFAVDAVDFKLVCLPQKKTKKQNKKKNVGCAMKTSEIRQKIV